MSKDDTCQRISRSYQARYPDIPPISSREFISSLLQSPDDNKYQPFCLIDVRTQAERNVSMLEGAISLEEFERQGAVSQLSPDVHVITYCTVGYRSGLEARRLRNRCGLEGRIYHLDGIVAYTHAVATAIDQRPQSIPQECDQTGDNVIPKSDPTSDNDQTKTVPKITNPQTGDETRRVHTFGSIWDNLHDDYNGVYFSFPALVIRLLQVGGLVIVRSIQSMGYNCKSCCYR